MNLVKTLHPQNIFVALDQVDQEAPSYSLDRPQAMRRIFWTLACVSVALLMIHYLKYNTSFRAFLSWVSVLQGEHPNHWLHIITRSQFGQLFSYCWWTFWHVIGYVLLPFLFSVFILKTRFVSLGWQWGDTHKHWRGYLLLLSPILVFVVIASQGKDFVQHYPFYKLAGRSWFDFLAWQALYLLQFACLEFFFRGFMIQALRPAMGANAVWVMCVPYLMIHFPKLWPEAAGAILFGLFLGILALRSRSIWGGFFVHAGVAVSMDITSLLAQGKIPQQFWPL